MTLAEMIERNEGRRAKPYLDTRGNLTIGVGRNLSDVGLSDFEIDTLLQHDIGRAKSAVHETLGRRGTPAPRVGSPRFAALVDMAFNLGQGGLSGFGGMLDAIHRDDWDRAADEALYRRPPDKAPTPYAARAPRRAARNAYMLRTGEWPPE